MASRAKRVTRTYSRRNRNYDSRNKSHSGIPPPENVHPSLSPPQPPATQAIDIPSRPCVYQENRAHNGLEYTLRIMCDGVARVERQFRSVKRAASGVQDEIKAAVTCSICLSAFKHPFMTNCGHSFCLECILGWLSVQLDDFQASNPGFILADNAMDILRNPLSNPDGFVEAVKMAKLRYPRFTCPACRSVMTRRPVPFVAVEHVFTNPCVRGGGGAEAAPPSQLDLSQANRCFEHYLLF